MAVFEIRTPILSTVAKRMVELMTEIGDGTVENNQAGRLIGASNATCRAVTTDIAARMAMPKLMKIEAMTAAA